MANFNYYLNRQGSIGRQGIKGDKGEAGYSPYIDIKSNTPTEFIMTIHNETESFDTPNLIPTAIGEKVTEMDAVLTTHTEDIANLKLEDQNINTNIISLQGDLTNLSGEVNTLSGEVATNSVAITNIKNKNTAQDSDIAALKTRVGGTEESIEDLNHKYTVLGSEVSDLTRTKQNRLVEGANITLTNNADGTTTISSTGGGGGGSSPLDSYIEGSTTENVTTITAKNGKALELSAPTIAVGDNLVNEINGANTQLYLKQGDIAAGNNITVEKTATGVKISSTGGTSTDVPIATTQVAGKVKPDGTTITITDDGTISATGGGSGTGDVTAAGNNTFTGSNTFTSTTTFNAPIAVSSGGSTIETSLNGDTSTYIDLKVNSQADLILGTGTVATQDADGGTHIRDGQIKDASGNILLSQGNITAGNNITITKTAKGIQIASSGGSSEPPANMVTTDTNQDITGIKTFKGNASNNDPSIIFGGKRTGMDDAIGGKIKVNGSNNFEISTGAKDDSGLALRMTKNASNSPSYFEFTSNASDIIPAIKLGLTNYQGTIKYDTSVYPFGFLFETQNALSGYPYSSFKIADDTLTFTKTDGTVVDLLAGGSSEPPANMVTTDTDQFITGTKSFYGSINLKGSETDNYYSMITNTGGSIKLQPQYGNPAGLNVGISSLTYTDASGIDHNLLPSGGSASITRDEYYYKAGDVFTNESYTVLPAIFSNGKTQILMSIPMPKSMKNVSNISVTKCLLSVRVPSGGYLPSAHFDFLAEAGTTITTYKAFDNLLTLRIDKTAGWETQVANNVPLAVQISPADLIVEFN